MAFHSNPLHPQTSTTPVGVTNVLFVLYKHEVLYFEAIDNRFTPRQTPDPLPSFLRRPPSPDSFEIYILFNTCEPQQWSVGGEWEYNGRRFNLLDCYKANCCMEYDPRDRIWDRKLDDGKGLHFENVPWKTPDNLILTEPQVEYGHGHTLSLTFTFATEDVKRRTSILPTHQDDQSEHAPHDCGVATEKLIIRHTITQASPQTYAQALGSSQFNAKITIECSDSKSYSGEIRCYTKDLDDNWILCKALCFAETSSPTLFEWHQTTVMSLKEDVGFWIRVLDCSATSPNNATVYEESQCFQGE